MNFKERLRQLRNEQKLSQQELGKRLHLGTSAISMYERGEREPDFEKLEMIADFFNVNIDYLLGKSEIRKPEQAATGNQSKPDENDIRVALFGGDGEVTDEMWEKMKDYANYLKSTYKK